MKKITFYFLVAFLSVSWMEGFTQQQNLDETFIINGGVYSNESDHVSVTFYNHSDDQYQVVDSIYTQSTQDALIEGNKLFVCAEDSLIRYDVESMARQAAIELSGLNQLAVYDDKLLVSRQYPVTNQSFKILDKSSLEEIETISLSGEAAGIEVYMDSAYVAVPGAWGTPEGKLAVVDLTNLELSREINFGAEAQGLKEVFLKNSMIYTVNTNFSNTTENSFSVSCYDVFNEEIETNTITGDYYGYYGNSELVNNKIYIPVSSSIASYDLTTQEIDFDFIEIVPAALEYDSADENLHITTSDFSTYGEYQVYNLSGEQVQEAIEVGVSPEAMAHSYQVVNEFTFNEVDFWIGEGDKEAMLVIDWNDGVDPVSMAWGYYYDGEVTASQMMEDISASDAYLDIVTGGGFLNDIVYEGESFSHSGIGGDPDYWSTWSRNNASLWEMNSGIGEPLTDGIRFGCSYGFNPEATPPDVPVAAPQVLTGISGVKNFDVSVYQSGDYLTIDSPEPLKSITFYDISGRRLHAVRKKHAGRLTVNKSELEAQIVVVSMVNMENQRINQKIVVK